MLNSIRNKIFLFILLPVLFFTGCSENAPEISEVFWQLNVFRDEETKKESQALTLFVRAEDKDGSSDFESLYLINDREELFWKVTGSDLRIEKHEGDETWVGSSCIRMIPDKLFPDGKYRVILVDASGDRDETEAVLKNNIEERGFDWPVPEIRERKLSIRGNAEYVWIFRNDGKYDSELKVEKGRELRIDPERFSYCYLYRYLPEDGYGLINGPFRK